MIQAAAQEIKPVGQITNSEPVYHLTEICSDGFVRNYGSEALRGRSMIIIRPHASTVQEGLLIDQLIDEILPPPYRNIYNPGWVRSSGQKDRITPSKLKEILQRLQICQIANGNLQSTRVNILQVLKA